MPTLTPTVPQKLRFAASDPAVAREFMDQAYGGKLQISRSRESTWRVTLDQVDAGVVAASDLDMPVDLTFDIDGQEQFVFTRMIDGGAQFDRPGGMARYARGDVYLAIEPTTHCACRTLHARAHTITLAAPVLADVATTMPDEPPAPVRFLAYEPVGDGGVQWRTTSRFVADLLSDPVVGASPLVIGSAARMLAATALAVFPNTAVADSTSRDRRDATATTLQRAITFIEANPDLQLGLTDIARAACVSPRAVQMAFRRHLDITPMAYLRRVRLDLARADLLAATHGDGTTVSAVAARWGYARASRFAADYRAAYGELPHHTLRS